VASVDCKLPKSMASCRGILAALGMDGFRRMDDSLGLNWLGTRAVPYGLKGHAGALSAGGSKPFDVWAHALRVIRGAPSLPRLWVSLPP
jgi:hypothetical protein